MNVIRIHTEKGHEYALTGKLDLVELSTTSGYTPQHNPISERINRSLKDPARTMLMAADLPHSFWADAIQHAVQIENQLPHSAIGTTAFEKLRNVRPSAKYWRVFGFKANTSS